MIFEEKIVFSKRKTPKFSRLRRGYTLSNPKKFRACGAATTQSIIQNISHVVQKVIIQKQLSDDVHKVIIQKQLSGDVQKQLFKSYYPKRLMTFKSNYSQNQLSNNCSWSRYYPSNFQICMRLSRSLHMHKTFGKEKVRRRREKKWIQELKQAFLVHKNMINRQKSSKK